MIECRDCRWWEQRDQYQGRCRYWPPTSHGPQPPAAPDDGCRVGEPVKALPIMTAAQFGRVCTNELAAMADDNGVVRVTIRDVFAP